jgi:hypothetical protein
MPLSLGEAVEAAQTRLRSVTFDDLSELDRVLITIWTLEAEVNNGGFHQYYFNSAGDWAHYAPVALRAIGAHTMADIVEHANALFGSNGPPRERAARQTVLLAFADGDARWGALDAQFWTYPDDVATLLQEFLDAHGRHAEPDSDR